MVVRGLDYGTVRGREGVKLSAESYGRAYDEEDNQKMV